MSKGTSISDIMLGSKYTYCLFCTDTVRVYGIDFSSTRKFKCVWNRDIGYCCNGAYFAGGWEFDRHLLDDIEIYLDYLYRVNRCGFYVERKAERSRSI